MRFRLSTLICLTGLAACSHQSETAPINDASNADADAYNSAALDTSTPQGEATSLPSNTTDGVNNNPDMGAQDRPAGTGAPSGMTPAAGSTPVSDAEKPSPVADKPAAAAAAPDNTKVNKRDADSAALTPTDQKENQTDLKITQQIRQAVMADDSLSFTAKNVKIITMNGKVTLRGPVNTAQERSAIEAAARKVAGATSVDNQLEVKK